MTDRSARRALAAFAAIVTPTALATPAAAQGPFAGAWTVRAWRPAPWLDSAAARAVRPNRDVLGGRVGFAARRVRGPALLACDAASHELKAVPFEGLFQGNLTRPAEQARALGFARPPVATLAPGCAFEFHFRDRSTGMFALDDVLYTIVRAR